MPISDSGRSNWFYSLGSYNDTWGTDMFLLKPVLQSQSLLYYPLENPVLSFRTKNNLHGFEERVPVIINVWGLNIKRLKVDYQNRQFYGSE